MLLNRLEGQDGTAVQAGSITTSQRQVRSSACVTVCAWAACVCMRFLLPVNTLEVFKHVYLVSCSGLALVTIQGAFPNLEQCSQDWPRIPCNPERINRLPMFIFTINLNSSSKQWHDMPNSLVTSLLNLLRNSDNKLYRKARCTDVQPNVNFQ